MLSIFIGELSISLAHFYEVICFLIIKFFIYSGYKSFVVYDLQIFPLSLYLSFILLTESFKNNYLCINFFKFLAVLDLHCCTWAFSSCGEQGLF